MKKTTVKKKVKRRGVGRPFADPAMSNATEAAKEFRIEFFDENGERMGTETAVTAKGVDLILEEYSQMNDDCKAAVVFGAYERVQFEHTKIATKRTKFVS